jgi:formylmethanofuran dehydrogenase subunit E
MHSEEQLNAMIGEARKLHGHLGPFLVIGVRMGALARRAFSVSGDQCASLRASVKVPLFPPFSCLLDGIQTSTTCTVGNQRLTIENSKEICVSFMSQNSGKTLKIMLNPRIIEELNRKLAEPGLTEKCALEIAKTPEDQLFTTSIE